jgi:N-acetylmuramic acid 6-phosphate etherase
VRRARELGAYTVGLTAEPRSPLTSACDLAIVPMTGPEVILGSTRLKAGTAQKMVLNTLSTGVMTRLGRTYSNLMVAMPATNEKLRRRARHMVALASGASIEESARALDAAGGDVRVALVVLRLGVSPDEARARLEKHEGRLREVFGE